MHICLCLSLYATICFVITGVVYFGSHYGRRMSVLPVFVVCNFGAREF